MNLLNQREAAEVLRLSISTLERLRVSGGGPRFVKMRKRVLYRADDLSSWLASRVVSSTSAVRS